MENKTPISEANFDFKFSHAKHDDDHFEMLNQLSEAYNVNAETSTLTVSYNAFTETMSEIISRAMTASDVKLTLRDEKTQVAYEAMMAICFNGINMRGDANVDPDWIATFDCVWKISKTKQMIKIGEEDGKQ